MGGKAGPKVSRKGEGVEKKDLWRKVVASVCYRGSMALVFTA